MLILVIQAVLNVHHYSLLLAKYAKVDLPSTLPSMQVSASHVKEIAQHVTLQIPPNVFLAITTHISIQALTLACPVLPPQVVSLVL